MKQLKFFDDENKVVHGGIRLDDGDVICACCGAIIPEDEQSPEYGFILIEEYDNWVDFSDEITDEDTTSLEFTVVENLPDLYPSHFIDALLFKDNLGEEVIIDRDQTIFQDENDHVTVIFKNCYIWDGRNMTYIDTKIIKNYEFVKFIYDDEAPENIDLKLIEEIKAA